MAIRLLSAIFAPGSQQDTETPTSATSKRSKLRMLLAVGCLGFIVSSSSGCTNLEYACKKLRNTECLDKFMIGYRNSALAAKAWHREKHCFKHRGNLRDFEAGFMQGYADVAAGGNGCVPAVAPAKYWGWQYQSDIGQRGVNAWYQGYPLGVRAAEKDGVGNWGDIHPIGLQGSMAKSPVFPAQPMDPGMENPFQAPIQQAPYEPIPPGQPYMERLDRPEPYRPDAAEDTEFGNGQVLGEPVREPIPDELDAPAPRLEAPAAPLEAPALESRCSAGVRCHRFRRCSTRCQRPDAK